MLIYFTVHICLPSLQIWVVDIILEVLKWLYYGHAQE